MPYVLISTQNVIEAGPTVCGDADADPELMKAIGAEKTRFMGDSYDCFVCQDSPRAVLNRLETKGYEVVGMSGAGQTVVWTLKK